MTGDAWWKADNHRWSRVKKPASVVPFRVLRVGITWGPSFSLRGYVFIEALGRRVLVTLSCVN